MLRHPAVVRGEMGKVLAEFLVEFLPFEEDPQTIIESVRLVLQPGLIGPDTRMSIWKRGQQKNVFLAGFLVGIPEDLPDPVPPHPRAEELDQRLQPLVQAGNTLASHLLRALSGSGQTFLRTCEQVARKPSNQDVVVSLLEAMHAYFFLPDVTMAQRAQIDDIERTAALWCAGQDAPDQPQPRVLRDALAALPDLADMLHATLVLSQVGEPAVRAIFSHTDAVGSLMRRKVEPVIGPVLRQLGVLRSA
jgi:hypothetical protein